MSSSSGDEGVTEVSFAAARGDAASRRSAETHARRTARKPQSKRAAAEKNMAKPGVSSRLDEGTEDEHAGGSSERRRGENKAGIPVEKFVFGGDDSVDDSGGDAEALRRELATELAQDEDSDLDEVPSESLQQMFKAVRPLSLSMDSRPKKTRFDQDDSSEEDIISAAAGRLDTVARVPGVTSKTRKKRNSKAKDSFGTKAKRKKIGGNIEVGVLEHEGEALAQAAAERARALDEWKTNRLSGKRVPSTAGRTSRASRAGPAKVFNKQR